MRIAFVADVHGNLPALEAVIADLERLMSWASFLALVGEPTLRSSSKPETEGPFPHRIK